VSPPVEFFYQPLIDIVGTHASSSGRSCEEHKCCGKCVIALDIVLRLRLLVQVNIDGVERPAVAAYWVTDGIDRCRVGFIKAELTETQSSREEYDGRLVQVVAICRKNSESSEDRAAAWRYFGCCRAAFIETRKENSKVSKKDNSRGENNQTVQQEEGSRKSSGLMQHVMTIRPLLTTTNLLNPLYSKELMQTTMDTNFIELVETTSNYL
jgi:hypothetical protein